MQFVVYGRAVPQGSKRHVGNGILIESAKTLKPWRQLVAETAMVERKGTTIPRAMPIAVNLAFFFQKPASAPRKRLRPTVKPDADKLARSILDALTGVIFEDDAQVVTLSASKVYGIPERVEIHVVELKD